MWVGDERRGMSILAQLSGSTATVLAVSGWQAAVASVQCMSCRLHSNAVIRWLTGDNLGYTEAVLAVRAADK